MNTHQLITVVIAMVISWLIGLSGGAAVERENQREDAENTRR